MGNKVDIVKVCDISLIDQVGDVQCSRRDIKENNIAKVFAKRYKERNTSTAFLDAKIALDVSAYSVYKTPVKVDISNFSINTRYMVSKAYKVKYKKPYCYFNCTNDEDIKNANLVSKYFLKFSCPFEETLSALAEYRRVVFLYVPLNNFPLSNVVDAIKKRITNLIFPCYGNGERKNRIALTYAETLRLQILHSQRCNDLIITIYSDLVKKIIEDVKRGERAKKLADIIRRSNVKNTNNR